MKLFLVILNDGSKFDAKYYDIYVIAKTETEASNLVVEKWHEWDYGSFAFVQIIKLIAKEGQYGKPNKLLIATEEAK